MSETITTYSFSVNIKFAIVPVGIILPKKTYGKL